MSCQRGLYIGLLVITAPIWIAVYLVGSILAPVVALFSLPISGFLVFYYQRKALEMREFTRSSLGNALCEERERPADGEPISVDAPLQYMVDESSYTIADLSRFYAEYSRLRLVNKCELMKIACSHTAKCLIPLGGLGWAILCTIREIRARKFLKLKQSADLNEGKITPLDAITWHIHHLEGIRNAMGPVSS